MPPLLFLPTLSDAPPTSRSAVARLYHLEARPLPEGEREGGREGRKEGGMGGGREGGTEGGWEGGREREGGGE